MVRFLMLCTALLLLYLGFNALSEYDSSMEFRVFDYQIQMSLFVFIAIFAIIQFALILCLKMIFLIFDIPSLLKERWRKRKMLKTNRKLLSILSELLMGNDKQAIKLTKKLAPDLDGENKEIINLIKAETETIQGRKIEYLKKLLDKKYYSIYAAKKLAEIFYKTKHYRNAEECASKAFNEDDTDTELMLILIRVYVALNMWHKLVFIISKLQRADQKLLSRHSKEIASYYYEAAKAQLEFGTDANALNYLESALELRPDYLEALDLFVDLSTNLRNTASILRVLKSAFAFRPCFEIARIYSANSRHSPEANYGTLASMASPLLYPDLFLALAAYLELPDKVASIKKTTPLSYDSPTKRT